MRTNRMWILGTAAVAAGFWLTAVSGLAQESAPAGEKKERKKFKRIPRPGVSDESVKHPMSDVKPDAVFEVPGVPDWLVITDDSVWVSNKPKGTVSRMDKKTNTVSDTIEVGKQPCSGITAGFGSIWAPLCGDKALARIDMKTRKLVATLPYGPANSEGGVVTTKDAVWILTDPKGVLTRIDPKTNKAVAEITVPSGSFAADATSDAVWVTSTENSKLIRVNAKTNKVEAEIEVGGRPRFLATGGGSVWTYNQEKGDVTRVDAKTNKVLATIECGLPGGGGEISFADGYLWLTAFEFPITKIDPKTNKVAGQWKGPGGDAIQAANGDVWVSNLREQNVWRIKASKL